ncbi:MAG: GNAT family N-acetyltransferase [Bacteroidota bacterium]
MILQEVKNSRDRKAFLDVPRKLYKNDPVWVCPFDREIEAVFDPSMNSFFGHGKAVRWVLRDDDGKLAGRVAAFINYNMADSYDQPTGGMGFFECINSQEAANLLFDASREWLKANGMEAMDGPINFGETDKYWGLLVDGFTHPSYEIAYNHPYYQQLFENYGFQVYYRQEGFHLDLKAGLPPRFAKIAEWVAKKPDYRFEHFEWKKMDRQINDFAEVFNIAWATFKADFKPLKPEYIRRTLLKAKAIIEEEFIWIAYNHDRPIAIYLMYPDVNQLLHHINGRLDPISAIRFLWLKANKTMTRARGVLMGVVPDFQGLGVEAAIIWNLQQVFKRKSHYEEIEFSWVGDFNPKMRKVFLSVGSVSVKHYITYRYLFDRKKPFKRYPIAGE